MESACLNVEIQPTMTRLAKIVKHVYKVNAIYVLLKISVRNAMKGFIFMLNHVYKIVLSNSMQINYCYNVYLVI